MSWYYIASPSYWKWDTTKERLDFKKKSLLFISFFGCYFFFFQWGLICDKNHLKALTQAAYLAGLLVGSYAFSSISDHLGRRVAFFLSIAFLVSASRNDHLITRFTIHHKKKEKFTRIPISGRMWHRLCSCRLPLSFRLVPSRCGSRCRWLSTLPLRLLHGAVSYVK